MTLHLISGLPRAGSTLLCNILAQNPRFHATATSGILEMLFRVRNGWDTVEEFRAMDDGQSMAAKRRVLAAMLTACTCRTARPLTSVPHRPGQLSRSSQVVGERRRTCVLELQLEGT